MAKSKVQWMSRAEAEAYALLYEQEWSMFDANCEHGHFDCARRENGACIDEALARVESAERFPSFDRKGNPIMVSIPGRTE